ncbi:MAG: hypothetical protein KKD44_08840 [Proteobacteria bacterium]|nr:hypothetical protein [Pseudomonadota bacterium]
MSIYQNQRKSSRTSIGGKINYSRNEQGDTYEARLCDSCAQGMGLISTFPYLRETTLFLKSKNLDDTMIQKAVVAWSRPDRKFNKHTPRYKIGVKLIQ